MHANPNNSKWPKHPPCSRARQTECAPFSALIWHLKQEAAAFDRPVLLIHGSTNPFCLDRVFGGQQAEKLWRLNGPGDYAYSDAAVVTVARDEREPFRIKSLLNGRAVSAC